MTQMHLTEIYGIIHPNKKEYTFSKLDHIIGNKTNLNNYKKPGITQCILLDNHGLNVEVNNNTNTRKPTNTWKLINAHLNDQWVKK